jgi:hypothetical protein
VRTVWTVRTVRTVRTQTASCIRGPEHDGLPLGLWVLNPHWLWVVLILTQNGIKTNDNHVANLWTKKVMSQAAHGIWKLPSLNYQPEFDGLPFVGSGVSVFLDTCFSLDRFFCYFHSAKLTLILNSNLSYLLLKLPSISSTMYMRNQSPLFY